MSRKQLATINHIFSATAIIKKKGRPCFMKMSK